MKQSRRNYIKKHLKLPLDLSIFLSYLILIGPFFFLYLGVDLIPGVHISKQKDENLYLSIPLILLGISLTFFFLKRINAERKFKVLDFPVERFNELEKIAQLNEWSVITTKNDKIQFLTKFRILKGNEIVTLLKIDDLILINTQPNGSSAFTFYKEEKNYTSVVAAIKTI